MWDEFLPLSPLSAPQVHRIHAYQVADDAAGEAGREDPGAGGEALLPGRLPHAKESHGDHGQL